MCSLIPTPYLPLSRPSAHTLTQSDTRSLDGTTLRDNCLRVLARAFGNAALMCTSGLHTEDACHCNVIPINAAPAHEDARYGFSLFNNQQPL